MPKTIKEAIEQSLEKHLNDIGFKAGHKQLFIDEALAEIRQLLKECEPEPLKSREFMRIGYNNAIKDYTANIEKRLG